MENFIKVKDEHKFLFNVGLSAAKAKVLFGSIELDLFTQLDDYKTAKELAEIMVYNIQNTEHVLDALTSMDFLEKELGRFKNTEISKIYLSKNSKEYIGDFLIMYNFASGFEDIDIVKAVKEGPNNIFDGKEGADAYKVFGDFNQMIMKSQRIGRAKEICEIVKQLQEYKGIKKILDLGGGPGLVGIAIAMEKTDIEGVVFDMPETISVAKECIAEYGLEDRYSTLGGDLLKDDIGNGYDFVLAVGVMNFAKNNLDKVTKKIYKSLNDGGVFMCISDGLKNEGTQPEEMILGWLSSLLKGADFRLSQGQVSESSLRSGFKSATRQTINFVNGPLDVDILRK